jgi:hypothetical protein
VQLDVDAADLDITEEPRMVLEQPRRLTSHAATNNLPAGDASQRVIESCSLTSPFQFT